MEELFQVEIQHHSLYFYATKSKIMIDYFISNGETTTITLSGRLLSDNDLKLFQKPSINSITGKL